MPQVLIGESRVRKVFTRESSTTRSRESLRHSGQPTRESVSEQNGVGRPTQSRGTVVAGRPRLLRDTAFRVRHMGNVNRNDILARLAAIEASLSKQGHEFQLGGNLDGQFVPC